MLITVLARCLFEFPWPIPIHQVCNIIKSVIPWGRAYTVCILFRVSKTRSASTSVLRCGTYRITNTTSNWSRIRSNGYATTMLLFFTSNASLGSSPLFVFKNNQTKVHFDLRIFSMPTQTANKRLRTFHRLSKGIKFHFQQDCPFKFLIKTLSSFIGGERWCVCFHYLKARVKQAKYSCSRV